MGTLKFYICPVCGSFHGTDDRFPVCGFCKNEDVVVFSEEEMETIRNTVRALPEDELRVLEKGEPCDDPHYGTRINFAVGEYLRPKYVFNNSQFSKLKYNERINYEMEMNKQLDTKFQEAYDEVYGTKKIKCPTCGSTNTKKISGLSKAASVGLFGIFSQKVKHQFHCNSCGYEW